MRRARGSWLMWLTLPAAVVVLAAGGTGGAQAAGPARPAPQTHNVVVDGGGSYTDVNAAGLAAMLAQKTFPLINVHVPYEGEIAGTDLFIPFDQVEAIVNKLPPDKGARVVLYCRSGRMITIAAQALVKRGYTDVWNVTGGMIAWEQAGYPLRRGRR